jgi:Protein of unknown function (DUF1329)
MHLQRYTRNYSRRVFLDKLSRGVVGAGVLMPLWQAMDAHGEVTKAYPDELLSIENYTRGAISTGNEINAANVDQVKDLLEPIKYQQIKRMGRKLRVVKTTTDLMQLGPWEYIEATARNAGQAQFDAQGNIVTKEGRPWIGGNPFPDPKSALELFAGLTLSWGRHDSTFYAVKETDLLEDGDPAFEYQAGWAEMQPVARVSMEPKPYWPGHEDKLRFQSIFFVSPQNAAGTSFLSVWSYDQHQIPYLCGYLPEFRRIRTYPANQRFESLMPGSNLFLSDAWAAGDPLYTWGNYKIVGRGPFLAALSNGWNAAHPNWEHATHGGQKGKIFWDTNVELVPEAIIVEAEPISFPRAPVSKKRVWFDARTLLPIGMVSYDRRGEPYRSFDGAYSMYTDGDNKFMDGKHPYWSWVHLHAFDLQTGRMTRIEQVREIPGGHQTRVNDASIYENYLTNAALIRLGSA